MLVKWNSFLDFDKEWEEMLWGGKSLFKSHWSPSVDISEDELKYTIEAEIPGVKEEDIEIGLENKLLTVSGKKEIQQKEEERKFSRTERVFGSFKRSFNLPETISAEQITAKFSNGILIIEIPKAPKRDPAKVNYL